jgi:hypothetical protein
MPEGRTPEDGAVMWPLAARWWRGEEGGLDAATEVFGEDTGERAAGEVVGEEELVGIDDPTPRPADAMGVGEGYTSYVKHMPLP